MAKRNTIVSTEREIIALTKDISYGNGRIFLKRTNITRAAMSTSIWTRLAFFAAFISFFSSAFLAMQLLTNAAAAPHTMPKSTAKTMFTALPPFILLISYYYITSTKLLLSQQFLPSLRNFAGVIARFSADNICEVIKNESQRTTLYRRRPRTHSVSHESVPHRRKPADRPCSPSAGTGACQPQP